MESFREQANSRQGTEAEQACRAQAVRDPAIRPKNKSLTIFHSHDQVLQSWEIAALLSFQDLDHFQDDWSLKLNFF